MKVKIEDVDVLQAIQPSKVVAYLQAHGWREQKQIGDYASVWSLPNDSEKKFQILLPLDPELDDFPLRMSKVLQALEIAEQRSQLEILSDMTGDDLDIPKANGNSRSVADLMVAGASAVLSVFPGTAAVGGIASFGLFTWQRENQKKFEREIRDRVENLDKNKLDQSVLQSDEFKSLLIQTIEIASKSATELKRQALANALVNSVIPPTSQFTGKQALLRVLSQLSDEEMLALKVLSDEEPRIVAYETTKLEHEPRGAVTEADVAEKLGWSEDEARVACEGLSQLGLVYSTTFGAVLVEKRDSWRITMLAAKLIRWCTGEKDAEALNQ